jgi:CPA2 family monovalent cation:H+ antiporter-2
MTDFLLLAFVFLVAGVLSVPVATRLGLGSVLGYLIAGIAISPVLALLGVDVLSIQHFAEFGVVMMLFLVGLELEPKLLWQMRARLLGLGGVQVLGTALAVMLAAMALGQPWTVGLAIGLVLSLSSTAIVLQTLNEKGLMRSDGGQSSFAVLLFQDIAVIPMLALIPLLALPELLAAQHAAAGGHGAEAAGHGDAMSLVAELNGWQTALVTLAAIGVVVIIGSYLTRPLFRFIASAQLRELFTATALLIVIGIALLMSLVGLSPALGTFLAGVVLANSEYRHELESDIDPFKGLLLGVFFMSVGAGINFGLLSENLMLTVGLTLGLMLTKALVLYVLATVFRLRGTDRWLLALGLAQAGEFGFVLLSFTVTNAVIPAAIGDQLLLVVALSMLLTPALFILYDRVIAPKFSADQEREADAIDVDNHIIIAGRGRVGGLVERMLNAAGYKATVIDYNSRTIENLGRFGVKVYYGDATRPDLLHSAGVERAKLFVIAIDEREQITELTKYLLQNHPDLHVMARAVDRDHVYDLYFAGCRDIIRETYDSSIRMGRSAFEALGIESHHARAMAAAFDETDRRSMVEVADVYDPAIPVAENEAYIAKVRKILDEWGPEMQKKMQEIRNSG